MKRNKTCPNEYEHDFWEKGLTVLGIDEAGRGPLAGPLTVAGVVFEPWYEHPEIYDSKALSEKKREELFDVITENALYWFIDIVPREVIDQYTIYRADQLAFTEIAQTIPSGAVLTDAMPLEIDRECISLVKGDQKSVSIAAASILAKVYRDRLMKEDDLLYPEYGFAKNKGYGTKQHMEAIAKYGITPIHRRSFAPVAVYQPKLDLFGGN